MVRSESSNPVSDLAKRLAESCNLHDVEIYNDEYLCLGPKAMKKLFDPVVNGIVSHMKGLFSRPALKNVSCLFMVGGFAESVILQEAIKTAFRSTCKVLIPNYAGIAVVQGATMFAQKPYVIQSRVMATTYGFSGYINFNPKIHDPSRKLIVEGEALCKDIFDVVVKESDSVKVGERKRFIRRPLHSDATTAVFLFYTSTDPNAMYTTDSTVGPSIGEVVVNSPDISKGQNRDIELCVYFGETEIKATAIDKTSGKFATTFLDFLCK
ncbi:hypothetical protein OS493_032590 [Desmophyllum pertusum]|uniref:Heat shock protein 70-like protein n=1 Tax=Desmophyllum pertusum TaxID=174260 RepID=A0A9X0CIE0_9CNID|nr:hypothetical protein OS493_032590 [Desmophyllum pertusum]